MCLMLSVPFLSLRFSNHYRNIVMGVTCLSWLLSELGILCLLASWALCLSDSLAKLGHLHGDFGLKLGTKSWFRSDSKISSVLSPWVSLTFLKNFGGGVFSSLQAKNLFVIHFYPFVHMNPC